MGRKSRTSAPQALQLLYKESVGGDFMHLRKSALAYLRV